MGADGVVVVAIDVHVSSIDTIRFEVGDDDDDDDDDDDTILLSSLICRLVAPDVTLNGEK